jgi:hypothetical protein
MLRDDGRADQLRFWTAVATENSEKGEPNNADPRTSWHSSTKLRYLNRQLK